MPSTGTPATVALTLRGVSFAVHTYETDQLKEDEGTYGEAVAALLGVEPERLFKTLVAEVKGVATLAIVPVSTRLDLKVLAAAAGGKRARMADPVVAERLTGYITGGISPFGQKRRLPPYIDKSVAKHPKVFVSGGRRGLQLELAPGDLISTLRADLVVGLGS